MAMKRLILVAFLVLVAGCAQARDFGYGLKQINKLDSKYNTTIETSPSSMTKMISMISDLKELRKIQLQLDQKQFEHVVDYKLLNLDAEILYMQSQKYGPLGTVKDGFGCKNRPLIIESASLKNQSALAGFKAVELSRRFVEEYPKEAEKAGISLKGALFLNATFYQISRDARSESNTINHFCPANETLEIYKQSFRKPSFVEKYNFTEDYINNLSYEEAVKIYKMDIGVE